MGAGPRGVIAGAADPGRFGRRPRPVRGARRQDDAARRGRPPRDGSRCVREPPRKASREPPAHPSRRRAGHGRCLDVAAEARVRRDPARRALLGDRHLPPPSRSPLSRPAAAHRRERQAAGQAARPRGRVAQARREPRLFGLLARARRRRGSRSVLPRSSFGLAHRPAIASSKFCTHLKPGLGPHSPGLARIRRWPRRLLHGAPCPRRLNAVNRSRDHHRAFHPVR